MVELPGVPPMIGAPRRSDEEGAMKTLMRAVKRRRDAVQAGVIADAHEHGDAGMGAAARMPAHQTYFCYTPPLSALARADS